MVTYLIKSGICLALLLAFYHLILEREKMHRFNRFYLLGSVLFSFLAPFYKIYIEVAPQASEVFVPMIVDSSITTEVVTPQVQEVNYTQYLIFAYAIIALILLIRFIKNLASIYLKTKHHQKIKKEKATLVLVDDVISPHTFWNYIFINKEEYNSNKIETELFTHELTHALQKHTFDVLLIEFLQVMFWINPTFIFLKKAIKLNHEFLADNEVITTHKNTTEYQYLLLNRAAWNNEYYLASNLNYLLTKKRLLMMTKQSSRTKILLKKLAVIPVLAGFTFLFAERVEAYENNNEFLDSEVTQGELPKKQILNDSSLLEDIKNKLNQANSLKMSFTEKKDTFNIDLPNGEQLKVWENSENKTPVLKINSRKNLYYLNNRLIEFKDLKKEFIKETDGFKSDLKIYVEGKLLMSVINDIQKNITKKYLKEILIYNAESYIFDNKTPLKTSKIDYSPKKGDDSIPQQKRIINHKNGTFTYTTKDGNIISKKFSELTEEEKKMIPPPPPPTRLKQKALSNKLFQDLKNVKKYAIWIDGKAVDNNVLNNYKNTDFYNYSGSFVHKNARSKRFPQEHQYQLNTKEYIQKIKEQLPPPPPAKNKKNVNSQKKSGWIVNNEVHEISISNKLNEKLNIFDIISHDKILNNYTIKRYFLNNKEVTEQHLKKTDYLILETTRMKKISDKEINVYITTKK